MQFLLEGKKKHDHSKFHGKVLEKCAKYKFQVTPLIYLKVSF